MKLQLLLSKIIGFMGRVEGGIDYGDTPGWVIDVIAPIIRVLDSFLLPVIIILGVAGMIYGIVLGVQYAKAESADQREEAKKRMINAIIGIVIMLVLLILMKVFTANANEIFGWVKDSSTTPTPPAA